MRTTLLVTTSLLGLAACGPSTGELKAAHDARYTGPAGTLLEQAEAALADSFRVAHTDLAALAFETAPRWYSPEGIAETTLAGDVSRVQDNSINLALIVRLEAQGDAYAVAIEPIILRIHPGNPKPDELQLGDISLPGWVKGKVDGAELEIHQGLKGHAVATLPAAVVK